MGGLIGVRYEDDRGKIVDVWRTGVQRQDLWLYLLVRVGAGVGTVALLITRRSRHTAAIFVWAAVACDGLETLAERLDWPIWHATSGVVSGHNLKHVFAGGVIACVAAWLLRRRTLPSERTRA